MDDDDDDDDDDDVDDDDDDDDDDDEKSTPQTSPVILAEALDWNSFTVNSLKTENRCLKSVSPCFNVFQHLFQTADRVAWLHGIS